jgi:hypothetical protein
MRREVAANINELLDRDDPDFFESTEPSRISQIILTGGIKPPEDKDAGKAAVEDCRAQVHDVVGFKK